MRSVGRLLQALLARFHSFGGWIAYRIGCRAAARRHFERVLVLRGSDFRAYVHLGKIAFDIGDYAGWRREFEHARRANPKRFEKLRHPLELFEPRLAGTDFDWTAMAEGFDDTGARATWRSLRPFGSSGGHRSIAKHQDLPLESELDALLPGRDARADTSADAPKPKSPNPKSAGGTPGGDPPDATVSHDDCGSAAERQRLRELGPIAATEFAHCDLDDLLRRLSG